MGDLAFLTAALEEIREKDLFRRLRPLQDAQKPRVRLEGREAI